MKKTLLILGCFLFASLAIVNGASPASSTQVGASDTELTTAKIQLEDENTYVSSTVTADDSSWLSELSYDMTDKVITANVEENTGVERTAILTLTFKKANGEETTYSGEISIKQGSADIAFEEESDISETVSGDESSSIDLVATSALNNADLYASHSINNLSDDSVFANGVSDISFDPAGGKIVLKNITENTSGEERTATFTLSVTGVSGNTISKDFSISQDASSQGSDDLSPSDDE